MSMVTAKGKIAEICSAALVMLFVYTAISKVIDHEIFFYQLQRSPLFSGWARLVSVLVPVVELLTAVLLINIKSRQLGLYLSFFLMLLFTGYVFSILSYSKDIPCTCGGVLSGMSWNQHLLFNIIFTLVALTGIWAHVPKSKMAV